MCAYVCVCMWLCLYVQFGSTAGVIAVLRPAKRLSDFRFSVSDVCLVCLFFSCFFLLLLLFSHSEILWIMNYTSESTIFS